ncbi:MAG: hypothetical protein FJ295_02025 [Planctomycetes bacterium]|nr:hypothetical protein [Planctomycetota bacterium]
MATDCGSATLAASTTAAGPSAAAQFYRGRGYGPHNNGEDQALADRLVASGATQCDPCEFALPFYIYRFDNGSYHLSYMDDSGYREPSVRETPSKVTIPIRWSRDWDQLPVLRRFSFAPHVNPRDDKMPVELIGPVDAPGGNGPSNGMYARGPRRSTL